MSQKTCFTRWLSTDHVEMIVFILQQAIYPIPARDGLGSTSIDALNSAK